MHGIFNVSLPDVRLAHVTVPAPELQEGMMIQVTESEMCRDEITDEIEYIDNTWQAQVSAVSPVWNAPSELFVSFGDGPGAWILKSQHVILVMGLLNSHGRF
jgi:hypothetical protein